jgi:hypothetical protein
MPESGRDCLPFAEFSGQRKGSGDAGRAIRRGRRDNVFLNDFTNIFLNNFTNVFRDDFTNVFLNDFTNVILNPNP